MWVLIDNIMYHGVYWFAVINSEQDLILNQEQLPAEVLEVSFTVVRPCVRASVRASRSRSSWHCRLHTALN